MAAQHNLARIPVEIQVEIASHLANPDRTNLRLACRALGKNLLLRIDRVFLSANPLSIEVLRAIADNESYSRSVAELVWDDARLQELLPARLSFPENVRPLRHLQNLQPAWEKWLRRAGEENVAETRRRKDCDTERPDHAARTRYIASQPPIDVMLAHYKKLLEEQDMVVSTGEDIAALKYALSRFPSLTKITITPAAHGVPFCPLYRTPMLRALAYGFNYPVPRGWPHNEEGDNVDIHEWSVVREDDEHVKNQWRGWRIITSTLADTADHRVSELVVDVSLLNTGLNCRMFDNACEETENLATLLRRPGFRRIDLALLVGGMWYEDWRSFRSGELRRTLSEAADLEHVSLRTNAEYEPSIDGWMDDRDDRFVSLRTMFPVEKWPRLRHFGLSSFVVRHDDLVALLAALPATVRSVELSFLHFQTNHGTHRGLLEHVRDTLGWRRRAVGQRPRVSMGWHHRDYMPKSGRAIWIDEEVNEFIYGNGENPFKESTPGSIGYGTGIERDLFEPAHERPNVDVKELTRLGICKDDDTFSVGEEVKLIEDEKNDDRCVVS